MPSEIMASQQVFATTELLESVLLHLEMHDLLQAQRVSRSWCSVLQSSPFLQRKQFLGFVPACGDLQRFVVSNAAAKTIPPQEAISKKGAPEPLVIGTTEVGEHETEKGVVAFNPVFLSEGTTIRMRTTQFREKADSESSWLKMYMTQPPCTDVHVGLYYVEKREWRNRLGLRRRSEEPVMRVQVIQREQGVRAKDVLDELRMVANDARTWQRIDIRVPGVAVKVEA